MVDNFIKQISIVIFLMFAGCGNQTSFSAHNTIITNDYNVTANKISMVEKAKRQLKNEYGDAFINAVASLDQTHLFVLTEETGVYILRDYFISDNLLQLKNIITKSYSHFIEVYPLHNDKLLYLKYPSSFWEKQEVVIYDFLFERKIKRYLFRYLDDFSFSIDPDEKYFIFHKKKVLLPDLRRSEAELDLIDRYKGDLKDVIISQDKAYAYVVFKKDGFNFVLYKLNAQKNKYLKKITMGRLYSDTKVYAVDISSKTVAFFEYDQDKGQITLQNYDKQNGEHMGYPLTLQYIHEEDKLLDAYIADDGKSIRFSNDDNLYIDISNIYRPREVLM